MYSLYMEIERLKAAIAERDKQIAELKAKIAIMRKNHDDMYDIAWRDDKGWK